MTENYISPEGLIKLKKELDKLINIQRPEVIERIARARDLGDLSENAEYHEAREQQSFIEGRIQELESLIKGAILIKNKKNSDVVNIGSTVHATCDDGRKLKYTIVGHSEVDPANGKISHSSPIGQALIGKRIDDELEINVPAGKLKCKINKIE